MKDIPVRIEPDTYEKIKVIAKKEERSATKTTNLLLREAIERREDGTEEKVST